MKKILRRPVNARDLREKPALTISLLADSDLNFHVITEKEEKTYLLACPQPLRDVVAAVMLETEMRPIENFRLRCEVVLLEKRALQIMRSKTKAAVRRVHPSDQAKTVLKARTKRFDGDFLFPHNEKDGARDV